MGQAPNEIENLFAATDACKRSIRLQAAYRWRAKLIGMAL
jgi:hypothetical protein